MNNTKPWYKSQTLYGILLTAVTIIAGWFGVIPQELPENWKLILDNLKSALEIVGLLWATIGRFRAKTVIK